jgi:glucose/mannose transport system substrate-binding protein
MTRALPLVPWTFVIALAGCGSSGARVQRRADGGPEAQPPIELLAWLERIGDSDPLASLTATHRQHYPDDVIIAARVASSAQARTTLRARLLRDEPPDTFQANVGRDLMQWVLANGTDARESKLLPLDDLVPAAASWRKAMPRELLDAVSYEGKIYGVPLNVHRNNLIFYNKNVFRKNRLAEPTSVADLIAAGKKLREAGVPLIAIGSREPWTVSLLLFECLLVAREGPDFYRAFFGGRLAPDDRRVISTLQAGLELLSFANADNRNLSWLQAVESVVRGEAAMTVMGEWARGPFRAAGMKPGVDYGELPFPGTAATFVFSADAFGLPANARNRAGAARLLATFGSIEGQRALSRARGTLAARLDLQPPPDDDALARSYQLLGKGRLVMALSGAIPAIVTGDLDASLGEMLDRHDIEPVVQTLRSRYALLE